MRIAASGNVGIGTTTPTTGKLVVAGGGIDVASASIGNASGMGLSYESYGGRIQTFGSKPLILNPLGNAVGIGTTTPTQAALVVSGAGSTNNFGGTWIYSSGGAAANGPVNETNSIYASTSIAGSHFRAFSDRRIKQIVGQSDSSRDLATILGIEITDYRYLDKIARGNGVQKKVIAQQVEQVFPQAVTRSTDVVPDIYKSAVIKDGWINLHTELKKGERVRLISEKVEGFMKCWK